MFLLQNGSQARRRNHPVNAQLLQEMHVDICRPPARAAGEHHSTGIALRARPLKARALRHSFNDVSAANGRGAQGVVRAPLYGFSPAALLGQCRRAYESECC